MGARADVNGNGRVTLALLAQKLDAIETLLRKKCELQDQDHDRISILEGKHETLNERISRTNDRLTAFQAGQAILTMVAASIAGFLANRK